MITLPILCPPKMTAQESTIGDFEHHFLNKEDFISKQDDLKFEFGNNKIIPEELELAALVALSHFPELGESKIKFYFVDGLKAVRQSTPCPKSLLRKKESRSYFIKIRKGGTENMSFNSLVGILGHELAHVIQVYKNSSSLILGKGIDWKLSKRKRSLFEHEADLILIQRGLGHALYERRRALLQNSKTIEQMRYIKKIYMKPEEILYRISKADIN